MTEWKCEICKTSTTTWCEHYNDQTYWYCEKHKGSKKSTHCIYCELLLDEKNLDAGYLDRHDYCHHECDKRDFADLCITCGRLPATNDTFYCKLHDKNSKFIGFLTGDDIFCGRCFKKCGVLSEKRDLVLCHEECAELDFESCVYCRGSNEDHLKCFHIVLNRARSVKCLCCDNLQIADDIYCENCIKTDRNYVTNTVGIYYQDLNRESCN